MLGVDMLRSLNIFQCLKSLDLDFEHFELLQIVILIPSFKFTNISELTIMPELWLLSTFFSVLKILILNLAKLK
jgi:hypothetical protein